MTKITSQFDNVTVRRDVLRGRLRAKADQVLEAIEALPAPKTLNDAEQAAQAVMAADRMVTQLFSEPETVTRPRTLPKSGLH